jgi:hypothetical protein
MNAVSDDLADLRACWESAARAANTLNMPADLEQAEARWISMARPLFAFAVIEHENAENYYLAGDRDRALSHGRMAIGHVACADSAAIELGAADSAWATCCEHVHEYATLYTFGIESLLADMRRNRRLRPARSPSRSEARDLHRMQELQNLAVATARAIVETIGANPDIIAAPSLLYAELTSEIAPPWPEIEN